MNKQERKVLNETTKSQYKECLEYLATGERDLFIRAYGGFMTIACLYEDLGIDFPLWKECHLLVEVQKQMIFGIDKDNEED